MNRTRSLVLPEERARLVVRAFALAVIAQKATEEPEWARVLTVAAVRHRLARWIIALEDEAPRVLVHAARDAHTTRKGGSLATVLRMWLGFTPDDDRDGDRFLALVAVLDRLSWMERADHPLVYLRGAVATEARRIARDAATGGRQWARIVVLEPHEDEDASETASIETLARDKLHAEERLVRRDETMDELQRRRTARPRPALGRLLAVAGELRTARLSEVEERLLSLLDVGVPPADAERLADCEHAVYVNLLQKARRRAVA